MRPHFPRRNLKRCALLKTEIWSPFTGEFGSVMVVHTGPGLYGLAWWWEPDGE